MDDDENKKNVPEECDGELECNSMIICCSFNRHGTLLAAGCNDGRVVIWDFLTRCEVREIQAHFGHPVTSVSWSRNGHLLATSSVDNTLAVWRVLTKELVVRWFSRAPIMKVQFNPRDANFLLTCPYRHPPMLISIKNKKALPRQIPIDEEDDIESNMVASFDRRGEYIFIGNTKGRIKIMRSPFSESFFDQGVTNNSLFQVISSFKIQQFGGAPPAIRDIEFAPKDKRYFLVNSTDRAIRLYSCESALSAGLNGNCEELRKFQEVVNKPLWRRCCFSGEKKVTYVCGGSARQHSLYIWDIETGAVKKMLCADSKGEALLDVQWHPSKPIVVSVSNGLICIWARAEVENWSAYAPTFKELDENQEYSERESEFDIEDEDAVLKSVPKEESSIDDDAPIDVAKVEYENEDYKSSDEDGYDSEALEFIPLPFAPNAG
jgi:COMPASS component SWD1